MTPLERGMLHIDLSLTAAKHTLLRADSPAGDRLAWLAGELERLAGEAYRLADECQENEPCPHCGSANPIHEVSYFDGTSECYEQRCKDCITQGHT